MKPEELPRYDVELALEVVKPECEERAEKSAREGTNVWLWNTDPSKVPGKKELPS
jgi:hypothetical protein